MWCDEEISPAIVLAESRAMAESLTKSCRSRFGDSVDIRGDHCTGEPGLLFSKLSFLLKMSEIFLTALFRSMLALSRC